jgi:hypothetical protein
VKSIKLKSQSINEMNVVVVGVVRNVAKTIEKDINRLNNSLSNFKNVNWLFVESDSQDETLSLLNKICLKDDFDFITCGSLSNSISSRTQRIAFCRNKYLEQIRSNNKYSNTDYVIIADLDGVNDLVSSKVIESCWIRDDWDVCTANSTGPYYDIWALRHNEWSPNDCYRQLRFMDSFSTNKEKNLQAAVLSKMIVIPYDSEWIKVNSAFAGLAIYKRKCFDFGEYNGIGYDGDEECEHVSFHKTLVDNDFSIYINPKLICGSTNEHSSQVTIFSSLIRVSKRFIKRLLNH